MPTIMFNFNDNYAQASASVRGTLPRMLGPVPLPRRAGSA